MAPHSTSFPTSAALICLLLVLLPQSVVGFVSSENSVLKTCGLSASSSSSYKTSKLLQSSRVLPSDESSSATVVGLPPLIRAVQNLQERLATYRHVRKQKKLMREASESSLVEGFVPVLRQFLYKPNKMLLQSYIMAHQQAQYDHMHAFHQAALQVSSKIPTVRLSLSQRLAQQRREAKNARLAAKYAAIDSLEDRAFQICKDLGMI